MKYNIRPSKRFGQHFLRDPNIAHRIIESLQISRKDHILEIGPGKGILTELLLESPAERIIGVEIDSRLVDLLKERFNTDRRFDLIERDFLDIDLKNLIRGGEKFRIIGNIPYYVTTPILFRILENGSWIQDVTVTVQREVGERIISKPGSKNYGIPSVLFQVFSQVECIFNIHRNAFYPIPKVDSSVIQVRFFNQPFHRIIDVNFFCKMVKIIFKQRRKMLRNTLRGIIPDKMILKKISLDLSRRPEEISISEFVRLSNELVQWKNKKI